MNNNIDVSGKRLRDLADSSAGSEGHIQVTIMDDGELHAIVIELLRYRVKELVQELDRLQSLPDDHL